MILVQLVEAIRSFTDSEILPIASDVDRLNEFPKVFYFALVLVN